ncbi:MAG: site-specific integrase, partial [Lentilactobacillus hilgardii]
MDNQLADYLHFLRVERGLSENTIKSYQQDLSEAIHFFQKTTKDISKVDQFLILNYLENLQQEKKSRNTVIR